MEMPRRTHSSASRCPKVTSSLAIPNLWKGATRASSESSNVPSRSKIEVVKVRVIRVDGSNETNSGSVVPDGRTFADLASKRRGARADPRRDAADHRRVHPAGQGADQRRRRSSRQLTD